MSLHLKIEMILLALVLFLFIFTSVWKKKLNLKYSIVWILISVVILIVAIFPAIPMWLCKITGIVTPSNLVYLLGILALLLITFTQTVEISRQAEKIKRLTQILSIERHERILKESTESDKNDGSEKNGQNT